MRLPLPPRVPLRLTPKREWAPLTDAELAALRPYFIHGGVGRPMHDLRGRLDAIFFLTTSKLRWKDLPPGMGPHDTACRQFRRWAQRGVWLKLLAEIAHTADPVLKGLTYWVCRAFRRARRVHQLRGIVLARRLGLASALHGPPWMLPDPDLSAALWPMVQNALARVRGRNPGADLAILSAAKAYHRLVGGRAWVPSWLAPP